MTSFSETSGSTPETSPPPQIDARFAHLQKRVLKIITTIIEKKRYVLLNKLMAIAARETNSGRAEIERVVDDLIKNKIIVPGSRLIRRNILKHPLRMQIYSLIKRDPGINLNTIKTKLDLGSREIAWHLSVLIKFGCVQKIDYKNANLFAMPQIQPDHAILNFLLRRNIMGIILTQVSLAEKTLVDLEHQIGEEKSKILYNLRQLLDLKIIEKRAKKPSKKEVTYCIQKSYREPLKQALTLLNSDTQ